MRIVVVVVVVVESLDYFSGAFIVFHCSPHRRRDVDSNDRRNVDRPGTVREARKGANEKKIDRVGHSRTPPVSFAVMTVALVTRKGRKR